MKLLKLTLLKLRLLLSAFAIAMGVIISLLTVPSLETNPLSYHLPFLVGFLILPLGYIWFLGGRKMTPRMSSFAVYLLCLIILVFGLGVLSRAIEEITFDYILILLVVSTYAVGGYGIFNCITGLRELVERGESRPKLRAW